MPLRNKNTTVFDPEQSGTFSLAGDALARYKESLIDPWSGGAKIPLGLPVKSSIVTLEYRQTYSIQGSTYATPFGNLTLTTAGSPIVYFFQPTIFDANGTMQHSFTGAGLTLMSNFQNQLNQKGYGTNYASYRLVSAGIKIHYLGAPLYAKGAIYTSSSNSRSVIDYSTGSTGYGNLISDPDTIVTPIMASISKPPCLRYSPIDLDALSFVATGAPDGNMYDWAGWLAIDGYDAVNGISYILDICINYECIPFGSFEQLIGPTMGPTVPIDEVKKVVDEAKQQIEERKVVVHEPKKSDYEMFEDLFKKYILPFPHY